MRRNRQSVLSPGYTDGRFFRVMLLTDPAGRSTAGFASNMNSGPSTTTIGGQDQGPSDKDRHEAANVITQDHDDSSILMGPSAGAGREDTPAALIRPPVCTLWSTARTAADDRAPVFLEERRVAPRLDGTRPPTD